MEILYAVCCGLDVHKDSLTAYLQRQRPTYERLLLKLGAAQQTAGRAAHLVQVTLPPPPRITAKRTVQLAPPRVALSAIS